MSLTKATYAMISGAQVNALDLVTGGSGTSSDPWTGWDSNINWTANNFEYVFPKGYFAFSSPIIVTGQSVSITGLGGAWGADIKFTGTGIAFTILGEAFQMENVLLTGNASATDGLSIGSISAAAGHQVIRNVRFADFTNSAIKTFFSVTGMFDTVVVSQNDGYPFNFLPYYGIILGGDNTHQTTTQTIINPIIEGVGHTGIYLQHAIINTIIGGVCEANPRNIWIGADAGSNRILGIDLEASTITDLIIDSGTNDIIGVTANTVIVNGVINKFYGGRLITVTVYGESNEFYGVYTVTFNDGATRTARYSSEMPWSAYTPTITCDTGTLGTPTVNVARWKLIGNNLYLELNVTVAVASGSPIAIRVSTPNLYGIQASASAAYTPALLAIGSTYETGWLRPIGGSSRVDFYRQQFNAMSGTVTFGGIFVVEIA